MKRTRAEEGSGAIKVGKEGRSDLETMQSPTKKQWINTKHKMSGHGLSTNISLLFSTSSGCCSVLSSWKEKECGNNSPKGTRLKNLSRLLKLIYDVQMPWQLCSREITILFQVSWAFSTYSCTSMQVYVDGHQPLASPRERKATLKEFYAVIYPSLRQLRSGHLKSKEETSSRKRTEDQKGLSNEDLQRDEECGICMENCRDVVLPNCGHSMCLSCFQDWSPRSRSCPFCRNCLNRLSARDLWVLTSDTDIVDSETLTKENLIHFYLYIESLPLFQPDASILIPDYML
ncbi:E3 ubiquitin-protein ligase AIRP2, partial [Cucurbita argyrosperma subsp. sororia]